MDAEVQQEPGRVTIRLSKEIYEKEAVLAAAYALSGFCRDRIEPGPEGWVTVTLELLEDRQGQDLRQVESRFLNELVDQQLRLELERRYGELRRLIVQHAFAPLSNLPEEVKKVVGRD
jgi:His-Xaa-Ser system protein HxsD